MILHVAAALSWTDFVDWSHAHLSFGDVPTWIASIGTVGTLAFAATTIRQQGKALKIQMVQFAAEQERENQRREEAEKTHQREQFARAQLISVELGELGLFSTEQQQLLGLIRQNREGSGVEVLPSAWILVTNHSSTAVREVSATFGGRPSHHIWRANGPQLESEARTKLPLLAGGATAYFVRRELQQVEFASSPAIVQFTDEDGQRWEIFGEREVRRVEDRWATS
jgi:hypothetical protein